MRYLTSLTKTESFRCKGETSNPWNFGTRNEETGDGPKTSVWTISNRTFFGSLAASTRLTLRRDNPWASTPPWSWYPASPPKWVPEYLSRIDNLQSASSRNWYRIHQTFQFQSLNFPSSQIVVNLSSLWYQLLESHNNAHTWSKWTQRTW